MGSGLCVSKARGAAFCGPLLWVGVIGGRIITAVGLFELQEEKGRKKKLWESLDIFRSVFVWYNSCLTQAIIVNKSAEKSA